MSTQKRIDGRSASAVRPVTMTVDFVSTAAGSCLIEMGGTRVICTASITPGVPSWRKGSGKGWVTAEYGMLPASTGRRKSRPGVKPDSRGIEIQRLIGRVLRSVVRMDRLGENTLSIDCDVLEADGGTRCASITGAWVAMACAVDRGLADGLFSKGALTGQVAAVSVGIVEGTCLCDLCYAEDSSADVDMNVAMNSARKFIELQASSEGAPFTGEQFDTMRGLATRAIGRLLRMQKETLTEWRRP
jgi:ribonuclease PH